MKFKLLSYSLFSVFRLLRSTNKIKDYAHKKAWYFLVSRSNKVFGVTRELENTKSPRQNVDILGITLIVLFLLVAKLLLEMRIMLKRFSKNFKMYLLYYVISVS
jgi:hypothetical protein